MKVAILARGNTSGDAAQALEGSLEEARVLAQALERADHQVHIVMVGEQMVSTLRSICPDICCIAPNTQDSLGALQSVLELIQVPYVGSGSEPWRLAHDSGLSLFALRRFAEAESEDMMIEPLVSFTFSSELITSDKQSLVELCEERIPGGYPFEIKPSPKMHSNPSVLMKNASVLRDAEAVTDAFEGGTPSQNILVGTREAFVAALDAYKEYGCVVRQWVEGVQVAVSVLGTGWDAYVLPPAEWQQVNTEGEISEFCYKAPVRLSSLAADDSVAQAIRSEIERCAFEVCLALGVKDFAVVHLVWDGAQVRLKEIELLPSVLPGSAFDVSCKTAGLSLEGVLDRLVLL